MRASRPDNVPIAETDEKLAVQMALLDVHHYLWQSKTMRPAPNPVLRGCLFGVVRLGKAKTVKNKIIYQDKNVTVKYSGLELGQAHMDVWLRLAQLTGQRFLDPRLDAVAVDINPTEFMRSIGRRGGKHERLGRGDREWIVKVLEELQMGTITVYTPDNKKGISGNLVQKFMWDETSRQFKWMKVIIDNYVGYLFTGGYSQIRLSVRLALMKDDLALWLHGFIVSHRGANANFRYSLESLREKSGSKVDEIRKFRYAVEQKMSKIMKAKSKEDFYAWGWENKRNILRVFYSKTAYDRWCFDMGIEPQKQLSLMDDSG